MRDINLLPPEIRQRVSKKNYIPLAALMIVGAIVIVGILFFVFNTGKSAKQGDLDDRKRELADVRKQTAPMAEYEAQQRKLQDIQGIFEQANVGRVAWAKLLNELAMAVPASLRTATNPNAPSIWLTNVLIDAEPLEQGIGSAEPLPSTTAYITINGYATPAWLCIQTWLPRARDFKARGYLDAYPYYYYFRGQPVVAEFFTRLHNIKEWTNIWIQSSTQEQMQTAYHYMQYEEPQEAGQLGTWSEAVEERSAWVINFNITAEWDADKAIWRPEGAEPVMETQVPVEDNANATEPVQ